MLQAVVMEATAVFTGLTCCSRDPSSITHVALRCSYPLNFLPERLLCSTSCTPSLKIPIRRSGTVAASALSSLQLPHPLFYLSQLTESYWFHQSLLSSLSCSFHLFFYLAMSCRAVYAWPPSSTTRRLCKLKNRIRKWHVKRLHHQPSSSSFHTPQLLV